MHRQFNQMYHSEVVPYQPARVDDEAARHRATIKGMSEEKKAQLHEHELNSLAPSSVRSYGSDYKMFAQWMATNYPECTDLSLATWPMCVCWLQDQADTGLSQATIQRRWAFLRSHLCLTLKDPAVEREYAKTVRGLLKSVAQDGVKGKTAMMADQVLAALTKIDGKTFDEEQQRMFLLWSFCTVLRRSETAATRFKDVVFSDKGITIHVSKSKTGSKTISVNKRTTALDVVAPLLAWQERMAAGPNDYIFRAMDRSGMLTSRKISEKVMTRYVKTAATSLGLPAAAFGVHSMRKGGLSSHAAAGATTVQLMSLSAHKSLKSLQCYLTGVGGFAHGL
jgi:integrase